MKSKRQMVREAQQRQNRIGTILGISGLVLLVVVIGYFIVSSATTPPKPTATIAPTPVAAADMIGQVMPLDPDRSHIADDSDPGPYNSNPPTSGHHYAVWLDAGFYDSNTYKYPQGHLVHNLEHGYIIFWYNCKNLSDSQCADLKSQIKAVMAAADNFKVIAYPWDSIDDPLVMTSWGFMLPFKTFDAQLAKTFIDQHRNRGPEPDAP